MVDPENRTVFHPYPTILPLILLVGTFMNPFAETLAANSSPSNGLKTSDCTPPIAKKIPKEIITHGDRRQDEYFWLRDRTNSEVVAYLEAENAYADDVMQPLQTFQESLYREVLSHLKETDSSAPIRRGEYFYYTRTEKGKNYAIHCRKPGSLSAPEEMFLDENALGAGRKFFSVGLAIPSDD